MSTTGKKQQAKAIPVWRQRLLLYGGGLLALVIGFALVNLYNNAQSVQLRLPTEQEAIIDMRIPLVAVQSQYPPFIECPWVSDERWADIPVGGTGLTISQEGSAICSLSLLTGQMTPIEVNERLSAAEAYTSSGTVNWERATDALPGFSFTVVDTFDENAVLDALHKGQSVIARVQTSENAANWIVIYMAAEAGYVAADPLAGDSETLDRYGRVYSLILVDRTGE